MRRCYFSVLFGLFFPLIYLVASAVVICLVNRYLIPGGSSTFNIVLTLPITWGALLYDEFVIDSPEMFAFILDPRWIILMVGGNLLLYSLIGRILYSFLEKVNMLPLVTNLTGVRRK